MGLLSKLAMLPFAPVGGVIWLAEQLEQQAYEQMYGPEAVRAQLGELEARYERGEVSEEEYRLTAEVLLARLVTPDRTGGVGR
jgi:hypothetical protein